MKDQLLSRLDHLLEEYRAQHQGQNPLYIMVSAFEADALRDAARKKEGHAPDVLVTSYKGCKVVEHGSLKKGEFQLSNELPELSG